ncbi:TIGR02302 family protein [Rhizobiaceae bacterium BDR2-2]|uniref:TIGR02302 family protein n=1 Tax=Ectorhizobium quercum TaxID=2965071 RepID=A0AAE3SY62_9HYPH|nr:TIGR02302 family protein [Ectorhizobium quercum]MCX8999190.1 TIGR02302 family protein [Ectorhizobium quercum]
MNGDSRQKERSVASAFAARPGLARQLAFKRVTARAILFFERLLPRLIVPASIAAVFVSLAWFGVFRILPDWARIVLLAGLALSFIGSLRPLFRLEWPDAHAADRLLEERNGLAHQPVAAQEDRPANDTPFARALWREHQIRMAERIATLDAGMPSPDLSRFDRNGLRAAPVLLLAAAFGFSFSNGAGRLMDAFVSPGAGSAVDPGLRIDAWVTPPSYTGRAPVYLTARAEAGGGPAEVPEGSELTVRIAGEGKGEVLTFTSASGGDDVTLDAAEAPAPQGAAANAGARSYGMTLEEDGVLAVNGQSWAFTVIPDKTPEIAFDGEPRVSVNGALEIGFMTRDDYGVQSARADIEPVEEPLPGAKPLFPPPDYKLDLPRRGNATIKGLTSRNLTEHPLSGTRVRVTLVAVDAAGQEGRSEPYEMTMPARRFYEPLAASVSEQRQTFSLDTSALPRAIELNEVLALRPEETIPNLKNFLLIRSALGRMETARTEDDLKGAADYLWEIALGLEDGDLSMAERQMRDAQKALSEALERGASEEEIARLTAELRQAMEQYLSELARQMQQNPNMQGRMAENTLRQQDLNRMLDQIENLARSGNNDAAQQLLSELQRMMNNLQAGRPNQRPGQQQDNSPMRQQIDRLGELMQEQQRLMDQTFNLEQQLQNRMMENDELGQDGDLFDRPDQQQGQNGDPQQQQQGEGGQMTEQQLRDALKQLREQQDALGRKLEELQKGLADMGMQPGEGFGEAGEQMKGAGEALGEGEGGRAVEGQGRALEALRRGARDMMNQMMQAMQQGQGQGEQGQQGPGMVGQGNQNGRDPLGRPRATSGPEFGDQVKVPDEIDVQRARQILESIREKLSNGLGGEIERRYLERLLDLQ